MQRELQVSCEMRGSAGWISALNDMEEETANLNEAWEIAIKFLKANIPKRIVFDLKNIRYSDFIFVVRVWSWARKNTNIEVGNAYLASMSEETEENWTRSKMNSIFKKYEDSANLEAK